MPLLSKNIDSKKRKEFQCEEFFHTSFAMEQKEVFLHPLTKKMENVMSNEKLLTIQFAGKKKQMSNHNFLLEEEMQEALELVEFSLKEIYDEVNLPASSLEKMIIMRAIPNCIMGSTFDSTARNLLRVIFLTHSTNELKKYEAKLISLLVCVCKAHKLWVLKHE